MMKMTTVVYSKNYATESKAKEGAKLSPPWYQYQRQVLNLFQGDPELKISDLEEVNDGEYTFSIESQNGAKLQAIEKLIGRTKMIGNVKVVIDYKYADGSNESWAEVVEAAFQGNPLFKEVIVERDPIMQVEFSYAIFARDIISFWNDNLGDYSGNEHYIVADLAKEVVSAKTNINFCTEAIKRA